MRRVARRSARRASRVTAKILKTSNGFPFAFAAGSLYGVAILCVYILAINQQSVRASAPVAAPPTARSTPPIGNRSVSLDDDDLERAGIDRDAYTRIIAISTLIGQKHMIDEREIRFIRDPRYPGTALEQFADVFGRAIRDQRVQNAGPDSQGNASLLSSEK